MLRGEIALQGQGLAQGQGKIQGEKSADGSLGIDTYDNDNAHVSDYDNEDITNAGIRPGPRAGPGTGLRNGPGSGPGIVPVPWCMELLPGPLFGYQHTLSIRPVNAPCQCTFSTHPISTSYHYSINTPYHHTLSTPLITALSIPALHPLLNRYTQTFAWFLSYAKLYTTSYFHACGSCSMGHAVDDDLRVYGVHRLRYIPSFLHILYI